MGLYTLTPSDLQLMGRVIPLGGYKTSRPGLSEPQRVEDTEGDMKLSKKKKVTKKKVTKKSLVRKTSPTDVALLAESDRAQLRRRAAARRPAMEYSTLNLAEMQSIQQWTATEDGFQRALSASQVKGVADFLLRSPVPIMPPLILAKLRGDRTGTRWCIDGQHRLKGGVISGVPLTAVTIAVEDLEEARYLFMVYNSKASKISKKFIGLISRNDVANTTRELATDYNAFYEHVKRLGTGLLGGTTTKYWDEVAHDGSIPAKDVQRMRWVLDLWTADTRWQPEKFPAERPGEVTRCAARHIVESTKSFYCVPGMLQVVGAVIRELGLQTQEQIQTVVTVAQGTTKFKSPSLRRLAARNGMDTWCDIVSSLKTEVAKHQMKSV